MPVTSILIDDVKVYVIDEIRNQLTNDVIRAIKIPQVALKLRHGDTDKVLTDGKGNTGVSNISTDINNNRPTTKYNETMLVTVSNESDEDDIATAAIHQVSSYPIFRDGEVGVDISPMYIKDNYRLEFSYRTYSKTEAVKIYDLIRIGVSQTRNILIHKFEYNIPIPKIVEDLICDVYDLKSRFMNLSLEEYFKKNSTNRIHLVTDMSNPENSILAVNEVQTRVVGRFDFSPLPNGVDKSMEDNQYVISFGYDVTIETPRAMVLRYPVMIGNKPIPNRYIDHIRNDKLVNEQYNNKEARYLSRQGDALSIFESNRSLEKKYNSKLPHNLPIYDQFIPETQHKGYLPMLSILVEVDESDGKSLFNLRDLDEYTLDGYVLKHLEKGGYKNCTYPYMSFLYISLYQDGRYFDAPILKVDRDLNVSSKVSLDLLKPSRVLISFLYDINHLNRESMSEYMKDRSLMYRLVREYSRIHEDFDVELFRGKVDMSILHKSIYSIFNHYVRIGDRKSSKIILESLSANTELYNRTLIEIRDNDKGNLNNLISKGIIPNIDYSKLEHNYIRPPELEMKAKDINYDDNFIFIFPFTHLE